MLLELIQLALNPGENHRQRITVINSPWLGEGLRYRFRRRVHLHIHLHLLAGRPLTWPPG